MFPMFTGAFILALSLSAVATSFSMPLIQHHLPHSVRILLIFVGSCLAYFFCTLGYHIPPGQISGTSMAATVYAFATSTLLESAAFFDQKTVLAFSTGSGKRTPISSPSETALN